MLSFLFGWLLPFFAALPALTRLAALRRAYQRGLVRPAGWRWLLVGLVASQATVWLTLISLAYPTRLEPPLGALLAVGVMLAAARSARADLHPGLRGLRRPLPRDGLDLVEREQRAARQPAPRSFLARARPALALLPALLLMALLLAWVPNRALRFALLALVMTAPLLLVPYRWQWVLPLGLAPPVAGLLSLALVAGTTLPPGWWTQPLSTAHCPGIIRLASQPARAWCVDSVREQVTAFDPASGAIAVRVTVPEVARVFAVNDAHAWVQQNPAQGLVRVGAGGELQNVRVGSAQAGAADFDGNLWVIDVSQELSVYAPDGTERRLRSADGLLNNTANVVRVSPVGEVWVGSFSGLSLLRRAATTWQTIDRAAGAPGAIHSLAFGPEGSVWMLWQPRPGYGALFDWGLSTLYPDGTWQHRALGPETHLELSLSEDPLAIDAHGRAWFVTQSLPRRERLLGLVLPGRPVQLYSLGPYPAAGPYAYTGTLWRDTYGVIPDGRGGILLYTGGPAWWHLPKL